MDIASIILLYYWCPFTWSDTGPSWRRSAVPGHRPAPSWSRRCRGSSARSGGGQCTGRQPARNKHWRNRLNGVSVNTLYLFQNESKLIMIEQKQIKCLHGLSHKRQLLNQARASTCLSRPWWSALYTGHQPPNQYSSCKRRWRGQSRVRPGRGTCTAGQRAVLERKVVRGLTSPSGRQL